MTNTHVDRANGKFGDMDQVAKAEVELPHSKKVREFLGGA